MNSIFNVEYVRVTPYPFHTSSCTDTSIGTQQNKLDSGQINETQYSKIPTNNGKKTQNTTIRQVSPKMDSTESQDDRHSRSLPQTKWNHLGKVVRCKQQNRPDWQLLGQIPESTKPLSQSRTAWSSCFKKLAGNNWLQS